MTKAVRELVGLDRVQFSRVAMIAQGEFLQLLLAKTEERSKIFREIFRTGPYQKLQEALRQKPPRGNRNMRLSPSALTSRSALCSLTRRTRLPGRKRQKWAAAVLPLLQEILADEEASLANLREQEQVLQRESERLDRRIGKGEAAASIRRELETAQRQLAQLTAQVTPLEAAWKEAP